MKLPRADLRTVYLHWTAGDYEETFGAYHFCVALRDGVPTVVETHGVTANARDVRGGEGAYAAHVAGRNSHALGVAICGMRDATPQNFGAFALRDDMLDAACALVAKLCAAYRIPIDAEHVRTHAEAAVDDGYFGCGPDQRWDIARLHPDPRSLDAAEARATGEALRERVRAYAAGARGGSVLWGTLGVAIAAWALFLWHPWIDWFGR
jgi:hypothetical protein